MGELKQYLRFYIWKKNAWYQTQYSWKVRLTSVLEKIHGGFICSLNRPLYKLIQVHPALDYYMVDCMSLTRPELFGSDVPPWQSRLCLCD